MHRLYLTTIDKKDAIAYLPEAFFHEVFDAMRAQVLMVVARDASGAVVAGTLNFHKGRHLYGRYWGALDEHRSLHFELCYYQTIEFAIERGLTLFEAGAQGEHKLPRGFMPSETLSAHRLRHPAFHRAIADYIDQEAAMVAAAMREDEAHGPFRR
jgi:predicted N-acyltransferase